MSDSILRLMRERLEALVFASARSVEKVNDITEALESAPWHSKYVQRESLERERLNLADLTGRLQEALCAYTLIKAHEEARIT